MSDRNKSMQLDYGVQTGPNVTIREGQDSSAQIASSAGSFIDTSVRRGITIAPGRGNRVNVQCMPNQFVYGGFISQKGAFVGLIPSTGATPNSQYSLNPPLADLAALLREVTALTSFLA